MTLTKALNILRHHQLWRLGEEISELQPKQLTQAIDVILNNKKVEPLFESEDEAITWLYMNVPLAIEPTKKAKTFLVFPFTSAHAHKQVVEHLGEQLFKHQQEMSMSEIPTN
jgi:hypothetical protein